MSVQQRIKNLALFSITLVIMAGCSLIRSNTGEPIEEDFKIPDMSITGEIEGGFVIASGISEIYESLPASRRNARSDGNKVLVNFLCNEIYTLYRELKHQAPKSSKVALESRIGSIDYIRSECRITLRSVSEKQVFIKKVFREGKFLGFRSYVKLGMPLHASRNAIADTLKDEFLRIENEGQWNQSQLESTLKFLNTI